MHNQGFRGQIGGKDNTLRTTKDQGMSSLCCKQRKAWSNSWIPPNTERGLPANQGRAERSNYLAEKWSL
jgi:hypothetical protein